MCCAKLRMPGTMRCIGRSLLSVVGVGTSHGSKGASAYILPAAPHVPRGAVTRIEIKDPGIRGGRTSGISKDGTVATKTPDGWNYVANSKPNAITFRDFKALYSKCGSVLHRGTIRSIEAETPLAKADYDQVIQWSHKIVDLLNQHFIARSNGHGLYFVSLKTESGGPACSVMSGFTGGSVVVATYSLVASSSDVDATAA